MGIDSGWNPESHNVGGDIVRLNHVVCIIVIHVSPSADLNVQLTSVLLGAHTIPTYKAQYGRRFEMRDIAHLEPVSSVPEAARQLHFRGTPFARAARDTKMQGPFCVCPNVRRIKEVSRARAVNRTTAHGPLVPAEGDCSWRRKNDRSSSITDDRRSRHARTDGWQGFS